MAVRRGGGSGTFAALGFLGFTGGFTGGMLGEGGLVVLGGQEGGVGGCQPDRV